MEAPERSSEEDNEEEDDEKEAEFKLGFQFRKLVKQLAENQVCRVSNLAACL